MPVPGPRPAPTATPSVEECPTFTAFGRLPVALPIPVPLPGPHVRGSPSPISPLARTMDRTLREAFRQVGLLNPRFSCFFEIQSEGRIGSFVVYDFAEVTGAAMDGLADALRQGGVQVETPSKITSPAGSLLVMGLKYPDGSDGGLMLMGTVVWGWAVPAAEVKPAPSPTPGPSPTPSRLEPTATPTAVRLTGLAQTVDEALRPSLERSLGVRLNPADFATITMGPASQVHLAYRPAAEISLAGRAEALRQELSRLGLAGVTAVEAPGGITVSFSGGQLAGRAVVGGGGVTVGPTAVEVFIVLQ